MSAAADPLVPWPASNRAVGWFGDVFTVAVLVAAVLVVDVLVLADAGFVALALSIFQERKRPQVGRAALLGSVAVVETPFSRKAGSIRGRVRGQGESWNALLASGESVPGVGDRVLITSVEGLTLVVRPVVTGKDDLAG